VARDLLVRGVTTMQIERSELTRLLEECQGNVTLASRKANIERQSMHRLIKRHGLRARDFRPRGGGSLIARLALRELRHQLA
jgi:DNA-binding NtrC family response regulator